MYVNPNFKTKKAFKEAVEQGRNIEIYQPNNMFGVTVPKDGNITIEGPHYPEPHRWYASVTLKEGKIVKVK